MPKLVFWVAGKPAPQGSKRVFNGRMIEANPRTRPWRAMVRDAAEQEIDVTDWARAEGPIKVTLRFYKQRLKSHFGTGKNSDKLKDDAPIFVTTGPDADKLTRAILDACTDAGVWRDDAQVSVIDLTHVYANPNDSFQNGGVRVQIETL